MLAARGSFIYHCAEQEEPDPSIKEIAYITELYIVGIPGYLHRVDTIRFLIELTNFESKKFNPPENNISTGTIV